MLLDNWRHITCLINKSEITPDSPRAHKQKLLDLFNALLFVVIEPHNAPSQIVRVCKRHLDTQSQPGYMNLEAKSQTTRHQAINS